MYISFMVDIVSEIIEKYGLTPHPEGGYYREVYRSAQSVKSPVTGKVRSALTHIYFLLTKGDVSVFHKVLHDEIWNFYEGDPLRLIKLNAEGFTESIIGPGTCAYCETVPAGIFQAAETTGCYSLIGCTVAPGFDFADFSFLRKDTVEFRLLTEKHPEYSRFLKEK